MAVIDALQSEIREQLRQSGLSDSFSSSIESHIAARLKEVARSLDGMVDISASPTGDQRTSAKNALAFFAGQSGGPADQPADQAAGNGIARLMALAADIGAALESNPDGAADILADLLMPLAEIAGKNGPPSAFSRENSPIDADSVLNILRGRGASEKSISAISERLRSSPFLNNKGGPSGAPAEAGDSPSEERSDGPAENDQSEPAAANTSSQERLRPRNRIQLPKNVLKQKEIKALLEKEISRNKRYHTPFSCITLSFGRSAGEHPETDEGSALASVCEALTAMVRDLDSVGLLGALSSNLLVIVLPMTSGKGAEVLCDRIDRLVHAQGAVAGGALSGLKSTQCMTTFDAERTPDAAGYIARLKSEHRKKTR